jgi:exosome complex RNA-binding protein Rrp42 (RNase PH superfamily)
MSRPIHVLNRSSDVNDVVNMASIATLEAQRLEEQRSRSVAKEVGTGI